MTISSIVDKLKNSNITFDYTTCPLCKQNRLARPIYVLGHCLECDDEHKKNVANRSTYLDTYFNLPPKWSRIDRTPLSTQMDAFKAASHWIKSPDGWLYIYGPPGVGKTHLAALIANYFKKKGSIAWLSFTEYVFLPMPEKTATFNHLKHAHAIIIDGFAAITKVPAIMSNIFEYLLDFNKPNLILTSNTYLLKTQKIDGTTPPYEIIDRHIVERLIEGVSTFVPMQGQNLRIDRIRRQ